MSVFMLLLYYFYQHSSVIQLKICDGYSSSSSFIIQYYFSYTGWCLCFCFVFVSILSKSSPFISCEELCQNIDRSCTKYVDSIGRIGRMIFFLQYLQSVTWEVFLSSSISFFSVLKFYYTILFCSRW